MEMVANSSFYSPNLYTINFDEPIETDRLYSLINFYEEGAEKGFIKYEEAFKAYKLFVTNNFLNNLRKVECKFINASPIFINFLLFHACQNKRDSILSQVKLSETYLSFEDAYHSLIFLIKNWMITNDIIPFLQLNEHDLIRLFEICDRFYFKNLKEELLFELSKIYDLLRFFSLTLKLNERDYIDSSIKQINSLLPLISFVRTDCGLRITIKDNPEKPANSESKALILLLSEIIEESKLPIEIEIKSSILKFSFDQLFPFVNKIGMNIHKLTIKLDFFNKRNIGLLNALIVMMPKIKKLYLFSKPNWNEEYVIKQLCIALPSCVECLGIKCQMNEKDLVNLIKNFGLNLKHFLFYSEGFFTDYIMNSLSKYCTHLEVINLDLLNERSDVSKGSLLHLFSSCLKLKTIRIYNSIHSPPCNSDGYDLGILNVLQEAFPERQINLNYYPF